jgi:hypothetical protein
MQFTNKAPATVTNQRKPRKPVIAAAAVAGLLVPALAFSSPAMAATWGHTVGHAVADHFGHLPALREAPRGGQDQWTGQPGHPSQTPPPAGHGRGTGSTGTTGTGTTGTGSTGTGTTGTGSTGTGTTGTGTTGTGTTGTGTTGTGTTGTGSTGTSRNGLGSGAPGACACFF